MILSLFTIYDLSVNDWYFRPKAIYDISDHWQVQIGANIFVMWRKTFPGSSRKKVMGILPCDQTFTA